MSFESKNLRSNVKRQSKRLSKILQTPLGQAQESLATCLYACENYSDFHKKVQSDNFDSPLIPLAALAPNSEIFLAKLLESNLEAIRNNFEKKFPDIDFSDEVLVSLFGLSFEDFQTMISS